MLPYIFLGALLGFPLLLGLFFRVSVSHIFFSLMAGELLARYFGHDFGLILDAVFRNDTLHQYAGIIIIALPMILTAIFLKGTVHKGKTFLHIIPLIVTGVVLAAFATHELPINVQEQIKSVEYGRQLYDLSDPIIGGVVALQLIALWLLTRMSLKEKKHH